MEKNDKAFFIVLFLLFVVPLLFQYFGFEVAYGQLLVLIGAFGYLAYERTK